MEKKLVIFKTTSKNALDEVFVKDISYRLDSLVQQCGKRSVLDDSYELNPSSGLTRCILPENQWSSECDISATLIASETFNSVEESSSNLAASIHTALDKLDSPGTFLLTLLWICDSPPEEFSPSLYGALQRAVSWHSGHVFVVTSKQCYSSMPSWMDSLRAEVTAVSDLCTCHGLTGLLSPNLVWKGNLAFYQEDDLTPLTLPGFELHLDEDILSFTMKSLKSGAQSMDGSHFYRPSRYFASDLEVVSAVPFSSILSSQHILKSQKFILKVPYIEEDMSSKFLTSAFETPDTALIVKLKFSVDKPKVENSLVNTESWKNSVINCNFSPLPSHHPLGKDVSSINIMVYDDPNLEGDCSRVTKQKSAVLLKNIQDLSHLCSFRQTVNQQHIECSDVKESIQGKVFHVDDSKHAQLRQFVRSVQAKVLQKLLDDNDEFLKNNDIDDILIAIQDRLMKNIGVSMYSTVNEQSFVDMEENVKRKSDESDKDISNPDDWQERRFLRFLKLHSEKEALNHQCKSILKPSEDDYVLLEAKELLKFFDKEGLPSRPLEKADAKNKNCPLRPQKSQKEFHQMMSDNYEKTPSNPHSYRGFKFTGDDFSKVEFTQFHDVYYNTGVGAESYDLECKNLRDCMVGPSRETGSTFSVVQDISRLKIGTKKCEDSSLNTVSKHTQPLRTSPRKKSAAKPLSNHSTGKGSFKPQKSSFSKPSDPVAKIARGSNNVGTQKKPPHVVNKGDSNPKKNEEKRKSGGDLGDLSETNKKKLRAAVYEALIRKNVLEKDELFKPCFVKLFNICKMYVIDALDSATGSTKKWMLDIAEMNVNNVVDMEKMLRKRKK